MPIYGNIAGVARRLYPRLPIYKAHLQASLELGADAAAKAAAEAAEKAGVDAGVSLGRLTTWEGGECPTWEDSIIPRGLVKDRLGSPLHF